VHWAAEYQTGPTKFYLSLIGVTTVNCLATPRVILSFSRISVVLIQPTNTAR
jgi:hypothetical protein